MEGWQPQMQLSPYCPHWLPAAILVPQINCSHPKQKQKQKQKNKKWHKMIFSTLVQRAKS